MHSSSLFKFTTGTLAILLSGSVAYGIHQTNAADQSDRQAVDWQSEAAGWQVIAQQSTQHDNLVTKHNTALVDRYNWLVIATKAHEQKLLVVVAQAQAAASARAAVQAAAASAAASASANASTPVQVVAAAPAAPVAQPAPAQAPQSSAS